MRRKFNEKKNLIIVETNKMAQWGARIERYDSK